MNKSAAKSYRLNAMAALLEALPAGTVRGSETEALFQFHAAAELWTEIAAAEIERRRKKEKW